MAFNISNHAVLVAFNVTRPRLTMVDKALTQETRNSHGITQNKTVKTVKELYGDELKEIERAIGIARLEHYHLTLGWVSDGSRLLPAQMYMRYVASMREHRQKIQAMIDALDFPAMIERRRVALNGTFDRSQYPDAQSFKSGYGMEINISPVPDSSTLNMIEGLVDSEIALMVAENEQRMASATETAMKSAWQKVYDVVQHVADTLKDGNCSKVYDSLIGNVVDMVNILPMLNITNDPALNDLSDRLKNSLCKVEVSALKKDEVRQKQVAADAQAILDVMSGYLGAWS